MSSQMNASVRRRALRTFRQRGVVVHVGALECLFSAYESLEGMDFSEFLDQVFDLLGREDSSANGILTLQVANSIGARLHRDADRKDGIASASIEVIDAFTVPSWEPETVATSSSFFSGKRVSAPPRPVIDAIPRAKADMFRSRYELLLGKTMRNPQFVPPASGMVSLGKSNPYYQLTGIESLAGSREEKLVLGMLTQLEEGSWFLEDLNGSVRVDLSQASVTAGLHTECSFVIAQGHLVEVPNEEPIFQVSAMGTPPLEKREESLGAMSKNPNLFGGHFEPSESAALLKMESEALDTMFLLLSDVALDNSRVIAGLRHIFEGYLQDDVLPKLVVLMGNFLSHPFGQDVNDVMTLTEKFTDLGTMIATDFKRLAEESMFVIIPGTNDPGPGNVLPRPPLPKIIMRGFIDAIGGERVHLGTNPCRIRYMTQEIVLLRDDLIQKMVRHCSVKPEFGESGSMPEHFMKTIVDQSHLCPLPNSARPVLWRHAHAMWLFPVPHAIVLADKVDGYICKYGGTLGLNPGSFSTDFSFQVYLPAQRRAQQCSIDSEEIDKDQDSNPEVLDGVEPSDIEGVSGDAEEYDDRSVIRDSNVEDSNEGSDAESLPHPGQPREDHLDNDEHEDSGKLSKHSAEKNELNDEDDEMLIAPDDGMRSVPLESDEESDDDSVLVAPEGMERLDIKAMVRQSVLQDESEPLPETAVDEKPAAVE